MSENKDFPKRVAYKDMTDLPSETDVGFRGELYYCKRCNRLTKNSDLLCDACKRELGERAFERVK